MSLNRAPERSCAYGCGTKTRRSSGICARCQPTEATDTRPSPNDALTGGRWVTVGGIQRYLTPDDETRRYVMRTSPLYRALMAERYGPSKWWARADDSATEIAERVAEMVADFDAADGRVRREVAA